MTNNSLAKHTPGPWSIRSNAATNVIDKNERSVCTTGGYSSNVPDEDWDGENKANARLIAASPDLLEALSLLLEAVEMDIALFPDQPHKDSRVGKARAAIAKATASEGRYEGSNGSVLERLC